MRSATVKHHMSKPYDFFKKPILIIGTMRSGTTLLGRMLNAHPKIYIRYLESNLLRYYGMRFEPITNRINMIRLIDIIKNETVRNKGLFTDEQKDDILDYLDETGYSYQNLYAALALFVFDIKDKERWGEKYAGDCRDAEYFFNLYPEGQVIHITRDLLDVYASNKKRTISIENLEPDRRDLMVIEEWKKCHERSIRFADIYGEKCYLMIKYEDLVKYPETVTRQICDFLNLNWNNKMVNAKFFVDDYNLAWEANTSFSNFKGIATHPISRYKEFLLSEEQDFIEEYLAKYVSTRNQNENKSKLYQQYIKKIRHSFLSAGKYKIALLVSSIANPKNSELAEFLYHSYYDVEVISTKYSQDRHRFPVYYLEDNSRTLFDGKHYLRLLLDIFNNCDFDFIHINGSVPLDNSLIQTIKNSFNKKIFLTNDDDKINGELLKCCDKMVANSEKIHMYYLSQGIEPHKILEMNKNEFFNCIATVYRSFVLENKILVY